MNPTSTYDRLYALKSDEFKNFKNDLLQFKSFLEKRTPDDKSIFFNVAFNETDIFKKHLSRFYFVESLAFMRINMNLLELLRRSRNAAKNIYDSFKTKNVMYKLLIGYQQHEKKEVMKWIESRPEKPNSQSDIRIFEEKPNVNDQNFGIFDRDKVILFYKNPINPQKLLSSLFMTNKSLYNELHELFTRLWDDAEVIA